MAENENLDLEENTTIDESEIDPDQVDEDEVEESEPNESDDSAKEGKPQSRSENAKFAQKRREAEKAAKEKAEKENQKLRENQAYAKGRIAGIGGKNPYTEEPIEDEYDLMLYDMMKELDEKGEDPVKGLSKALRAKNAAEKAKQAEQEEEAKKEAESAEKRKQAAIDGMNALKKAHPECDSAWFKQQWENNKQFRSFLEHGYTPLEAYDLLGMKPQETKPEPKPPAKTPSATPGGSKNSDKAIRDMTPDEYEEYAKRVHGGF